ncbi:MAG: hypothetical protein ACI8S6_004083 [Myxococcota bacterium]|jgi:hypothetical protein
MRIFWVGALLLGAGCFGDRSEQREAAQRQQTPAEQAHEVLAETRADLARLSRVQTARLATAGPLLAAGDATTRAAAGIVEELHQALLRDPALQIDSTFAAAAPSLAARLSNLRAALSSHTALLSALHIVPLPPAELDTGIAPSEDFVAAAVQIEEALSGRWPLKRVFIAYALELEAIRDEAEALGTCGNACAPGVVERAVVLQKAAGQLVARLEEFAALYC